MKNLNNFFIEDFVRIAFDKMEKGGWILDLGCGEQPYRQYYVSCFDHIVAADFSVRNTAPMVCADAQALPFRNNAFDVILFSEIIEHVSNPAAAIAELRRVLRLGGLLVITWPFAYSMHELPTDYARFTEFGMDQLLQSNGFKYETLFRRGDVIAVICIIFCQILTNGLELLRRAPLLGRMLAPILKLGDLSIELIQWCLFLLEKRAKRLHPCRVGGQISGPFGHLALWTLGYCAIAQRIE